MNAGTLFESLFPPQRLAGIAVLYEGRQITYEELRGETLRAAEAFQALGVSSGDRVGILLTDSPEFIASFVALNSLGAIAVPINLALRKSDQLFILQDCGARAAIMEASLAAALQPTDLHDELQDLLVVRREGEAVPPAVAGIRAQAFDLARRSPLADDFSVRGNEDADAFILYTSGSTGEAKGAVHRQSDIFYTNETFCQQVLGLRTGDRLFSSSRLPFAYGLGNSFTFPLMNGLTTVLCREKPAPQVISQIFQEYRPTIFFGVPVVYRMLLEQHRQVSPLDTASLRLCVSAGEALPAQLGEEWERTFGVEVLDGIGSTEMLHMFMSNQTGQVRYGSSGKLLGGYEARLIDHEGTPTPKGEVGNLWIRGDSASRRYWQRPETTALTFVDGWVRTGDLYRCDADDYWWHMGRSDDCFKPTGQWVSPIEVENVLIRSKGVRACAVVEGFDKDGLSCVCAFVVPANDGSVGVEEELRALCEKDLPRFKRPRRYIFIPELPYTATGKVQRFKLREQLRGAQEDS